MRRIGVQLQPEAPGVPVDTEFDVQAVAEVLKRKKSHRGNVLYDLSSQLPVLYVFLRHLGCAFCQSSLVNLKVQYPEIQMEGVELVLVHMASEEEAEGLFYLYDLNDVIRVSDPKRELYQAFRIARGSLHQVFDPRIWLQSLLAKTLSMDQLNPILGDPLQMGAVFLLFNGELIHSFRNHLITDIPSYLDLAKYPCEIPKK